MRKLLLLFILFLLWGINCTKNPAGPGLSRGPYLYAIAWQSVDGYSRIYYIDTSVDSLVDSLLLPYDIRGWGISSKGDKLYLSARIGLFDPAVFKLEVNPFNKRIIYQGQNSGVPTPDGKYLIDILAPDGLSLGGLTIYDARFHTQVFHSDTGFQNITIAFDESRSLAYGAIASGKIGVFDYRKLRWDRVIDLVQAGSTEGPDRDIAVSPLLQKLYFTSANPFFCVLDLKKNKIIQQLRINSSSYLALTKDNRFVYLTDPGGYLIPPEPTGYIGIYSTFDEAPVQPSIDTRSLCPHPCAYCPLYTDQIKISPDGSKAYVSTSGGCIMVVIDIPSNSLRTINLVAEATATAQLLIQSKP
ncbi:MAG: hypothetical protein A2145_02505 [candidate division Zixibacteria bacterium RBG_16_40_9]|nr:MAG: hypothetical protein A2145_02505 [candidate division Zixibacteria bacterium RBG_16_40_9]